MNDTETAFTKQALLATKDWDTYQAILRKCLRYSALIEKKTKQTT